MSSREILQAEKVFIKDTAEGEAGNTTQTGTKLQPSLDHVSVSQTKVSPSVAVQSENTHGHRAARTASMETAVEKHRGISQRQCHGTSGLTELSSDYFVNKAHVSKDIMSPTHSADMFPTPTSSRESILSESSDGEKSWSAVRLSNVTSPVSFSRIASPCSSVCSGIFSPAVVQIKRHFLAPGSSLVHTPCFSSCESLSSVCGQSPPPPPPPRHRPPLTRLSLLTAILRKGRLPVLSSALQRPYTPCWPVSPVTLSFCNACSAASSVASIPLDFSSQFSSSTSIDSQSHVYREPNRCVTAPPPVQSHELSRTCPETQVTRCCEPIRSSSAPRWEKVVSPVRTVKNTLPRAPTLFCSNFKSVSPPKHEEIDDAISKKLQQQIHKCPEQKPINTHMHLKGPADNNLKKLISPSAKVMYEQNPQKWSRPPNSSLSRLHLLSQQLKSTPVCLPPLQPSQSRSPHVTDFCDAASSHAQNTTMGYESGGSCPDSKSASDGFHKANCLSPSRYTPIAFPGWPSPTSTLTPTPSPAPPIRDFTPSPSFSMRSTPSPRPGSGISDCSDREGKKRKTNKIKLSYKSLAAIPTNILLLDQQAIDEQVEREVSSCDSLDTCGTSDRGVADTHTEMCSPAERRQQSEELYAVIDEILANSIPASKSQQPSRSLTTNVGLQQNNSSFTKSLGRETKYASVGSLNPSTGVERKLMSPKKTNPGIIRPMTAIPRLTVEDKEEFYSNPLRRIVIKQTSPDSKKVDNRKHKEARQDYYTSSKRQTFGEERMPERRGPLSVFDLQITEPGDQRNPTFSPTGGRQELFMTHM
ncbi:muscular LMNA-interacting protein isoform X2 [Clinocottus analis]